MWQRFNNDPVCFEARDNKYGAFNVTKSGLVKAMKLVHRSESIECNPNDPPTFLSCSYVNLYPKNSFMTIISNSNKEAFLSSQEKLQLGQCSTKDYYVLEGVNQGSPELILDNLSTPLRLLKTNSCRCGMKRTKSIVLRIIIMVLRAWIYLLGTYETDNMASLLR